MVPVSGHWVDLVVAPTIHWIWPSEVIFDATQPTRVTAMGIGAKLTDSLTDLEAVPKQKPLSDFWMCRCTSKTNTWFYTGTFHHCCFKIESSNYISMGQFSSFFTKQLFDLWSKFEQAKIHAKSTQTISPSCHHRLPGWRFAAPHRRPIGGGPSGAQRLRGVLCAAGAALAIAGGPQRGEKQATQRNEKITKRWEKSWEMNDKLISWFEKTLEKDMFLRSFMVCRTFVGVLHGVLFMEFYSWRKNNSWHIKLPIF